MEAQILTSALLSSLLPEAVIARGIIGDFDATFAPGVYSFSIERGSLNIPDVYPYGLVLVIGTGTWHAQIVIPHNIRGTHSLAYRVKYNDQIGMWRYIKTES